MGERGFSAITSDGTGRTLDYGRLSLSAKDEIYQKLAAPYPLVGFQRWMRGLFASRIPGVFEFIVFLVGAFWSMFGSQITSILKRWLQYGPQTIDWAVVWQAAQKSFAYRWVVANPLLAALFSVGTAALIAFTLRLGVWARVDAQREHDVLETLAAGLDLAHLFRAYLISVQDAVGSLPPLLEVLSAGMPAPALEDITTVFVPLQLQNTTVKDLPSSPLDGDPGVRPDSRDDESHSVKSHSTLPPVDNIQEAFKHAANGAIALVGEPGLGKTTILRQLAWISAQRLLDGAALDEVRIPVYIDLAGDKARTQTIPDFISDRVNDARDSENASEATSSSLVSRIATGRVLILVDGLDEVTAGVRTDTLKHVRSFMNGRQRPERPTEGQGNRWDALVAVGSRSASYQQGDLPDCEIWKLLPLTEPDAQRTLVTNTLRVWKHASQSREPSIMHPDLRPGDLLDMLDASQVKAWVTSPLLLTLTTIDWARRGGAGIATSRAELYYEAVDALLELKTKDWGPEERADLLHLAEEVSLILFLRGQRAFRIEDFSVRIAPSLPTTLPTYYGPAKLTYNGQMLGVRKGGDTLAIVSGLFFRVGNDEYNILHQTILEYLVAAALARRLRTEWDNVPIPPDAFAQELKAVGLTTEFHTPPDEALERAKTLGLIWAKRTPTRWIETLRLMTGLLNAPAKPNEANIARPDLALTWVNALLSQPHDPGSLGLGLAVLCVAEITPSVATSSAAKIVHRSLQAWKGDSFPRSFPDAVLYALYALHISRFSTNVVTALLAVLHDPAATEGIREAAAEALGRLRPEVSDEVVTALLAVLHDPAATEGIREAAKWSLESLGLRY